MSNRTIPQDRSQIDLAVICVPRRSVKQEPVESLSCFFCRKTSGISPFSPWFLHDGFFVWAFCWYKDSIFFFTSTTKAIDSSNFRYIDDVKMPVSDGFG